MTAPVKPTLLHCDSHAPTFHACRLPACLLRHGESTWNVEHRWQGWLESPLTSRGEAQAAARARALAHDSFAPRVIYSSDLERATRTAEIIAADVESPVIPDAGFRERNGGEWQGCTGTEIDERWPGMRAAWRRGELTAPPGGEDDAEVLARFDAALAASLEHAGTGIACIVTHHGMLRQSPRVRAPMSRR